MLSFLPMSLPETPIERLIAETLAARGPLSRRALDDARGVLWDLETAA